MRSTKTTVSITIKLLSDLMDEAIFRARSLEEDSKAVYLDDERDSLLKQLRETQRVIARASKTYTRSGGL